MTKRTILDSSSRASVALSRSLLSTTKMRPYITQNTCTLTKPYVSITN